jgi:hypothetical protein
VTINGLATVTGGRLPRVQLEATTTIPMLYCSVMMGSMGIEYRISVVPTDGIATGDVDAILKRLRNFSDFNSDTGYYNYRGDPAATEGMPDASVLIKPDHLYFCAYGGNTAKETLGALITKLCSHNVIVSIHEL